MKKLTLGMFQKKRSRVTDETTAMNVLDADEHVVLKQSQA